MTFGQQSGPPASARQIQELLARLQDLGHSSFREARGPMRLTQRQAGGRFTRDEASAIIDRLQGVDGQDTVDDGSLSPMQSATDQVLRRLPAEQMAAELRRRNWIVIEP